jgi:PEP-CTERM motif
MPRRLSNLQMTMSRVAVSALLLIVVCHVAKADPVVPVGTVLGGTIIASSNPLQAITGSLDALDHNGNPFQIVFQSQGGPLDFFGGPGTPVVFQAGIGGTADNGNTAIQLIFSGTGPVIPQTNAPTLDLIGFGTINFSGIACNGGCLVNNPIFSFSGTFSGPVALHFTSFDFNGETRYQLRTATFSGAAVPEPVSLLLFGTGLAATSLGIRRKYGRQR